MKMFNLFITLLTVVIIGLAMMPKYVPNLGAFTLVVPQGGTGSTSFGSTTLLYGNNTGAILGTSSPVVGAIYATSTTATSTLVGLKVGRGFQIADYTGCSGANALTTDGSGFINCAAITAALTPWVADINANGYDLQNLNTITATATLFISAVDVGIGSSTPGQRLAVVGGGLFSGGVTATHFTATTTTATTSLAGELLLTKAGKTLNIKSGSNNSIGTAVLSSGAVVVDSTIVSATSTIFVVAQDGTVNVGTLWISARTAGTSFTISSTNVLDARTVAWWIVEQIP